MASTAAIFAIIFTIVGVVCGVAAHFVEYGKKAKALLIIMAVLMLTGNILIGIDLFLK